MRYNGTTGVFLNVFASSVGDAAGLASGLDKNLYVVDSTSPGAVTKLNGTTGALISTLTGGSLSDPEGIVFGPDHNLYVANGDGSDVVRFNGTTGAFIDNFVSAGSGGLANARGVTFGPDGDLYVTSFDSDEVLRYNGITGTFSNASVAAGSGGLSFPRGLVFGPDSNLYVGSFGTGDVLATTVEPALSSMTLYLRAVAGLVGRRSSYSMRRCRVRSRNHPCSASSALGWQDSLRGSES